MSQVTEKADRALAILNDDIFKEAVANVEQAIINGFIETNSEDSDTLTRLKLSHECLNGVIANLQAAVTDGEIEQYELEHGDNVAPFLSSKEELAKWRTKNQ